MSRSCYLFFFILIFFVSCSETDFDTGEGLYSGINQLTQDQMFDIDNLVEQQFDDYRYLVLGIVDGGEIVLTRSYGGNKLDSREEYASLSKVVTANITLQVYKEGKINRLGDPISLYDSDFKNVQPDEYSDPEISFLHLLTHSSGITHLDDLWKKGELNMQFSPGSGTQYSTKAFGVLGDVLEEVCSQKYSRLVDDYISEPIYGSSFHCFPCVQTTPGAGVFSNIEDLAGFARGTMNGTYYSKTFLRDTVLIPITESSSGTIGLGWFVLEEDGRRLGYHAGSNGKPKAFILIDPQYEDAVVLMGRNKEEDSKSFLHHLALEIIRLVNHY